MTKVKGKMDFSTPDPKPEIMKPLTQDVLDKNKQDLMSFFNVSTKTKAAIAISGLGILLFFVSISTLSFQNTFLDQLFPKQQSQASQLSDLPVHSAITGPGFMFEGGVQQKVGMPFDVEVKVQTATETASVMSVQVKFDPELLEVISMNDDNSIVNAWIDQNTNNPSGVISLVSNFEKGQKADSAAKYTTLKFNPKKEGRTVITIDPQNSKMFRLSDKKEIQIEHDTFPLVIIP